MEGTVLREVVLGKLLANFIRRDTHNRVLASVKILRKREELHSDGTFLQGAARTVDGVLNDVIQELLAPFAVSKRAAFQQTSEFGPHLLRL